MEQGITRQQSKILHGFAILMMLYHHLFTTPEALGVSYKSLLAFFSQDAEIRLAWFFKICVGIYAFTSGYGLCRLLKEKDQERKDEHNLFALLKEDYKVTIKQLFSFYKQYWLVFVIFVPIGFIFFGIPFDIEEFVLNFIGIKSTYNGAWWYVFFYVKLLLILPLAYRFFYYVKDKSYIVMQVILYGIILVTFLAIYLFDKELYSKIYNFLQMPFLYCFLMGIVIAKFNLYELCFKIFNKRKQIVYILGVLGMILCIAARIHMAKDALSVGFDFIFVPVICFGFLSIVCLSKRLSQFFAFFGKYSTYMWLTHVFFYDKYAKSIVMSTRVSLGIYATLVVCSLLASMVLTYLYRIIPNLGKRIWSK